jgi:hypothetical protein
MKYYIVIPEVPCSWGKNIKVDIDKHPPIVKKLHIEFDGWLGDDLITTFPVYAVTENLKSAIEIANLTGVFFESLEMSISETFVELYGQEKKLPTFFWAKINGQTGDDFYLQNDYDLIISENTLDVFKNSSISNAEFFEQIA